MTRELTEEQRLMCHAFITRCMTDLSKSSEEHAFDLARAIAEPLDAEIEARDKRIAELAVEIANLKKELARALEGPNESKEELLGKLGVTSLSWNRSEFDKSYEMAKQCHKRREP